MFSTKVVPKEGIDAFKSAIRKADVDEVSLLIRYAKQEGYNLNLNDPKSKYTLIHFLVTRTTTNNEAAMLKIAELLKKNGVDINKASEDNGKFTPLHTACRRALVHTVKWLLDNGANLGNMDLKNGNPYQTPLDYVDASLKIANADEDINSRLDSIKIMLEAKQAKPMSSACQIL